MFIITWLWIFTFPMLIITSIVWIPMGCLLIVLSLMISFIMQIYMENTIVHESVIRRFITNMEIHKWFYTKPVQIQSQPQLILAHPHGILCCGVISMLHFVKKSNTIIAVAPILFYIPIFGWLLRYAGAIPATYAFIKKTLKKHSVILVLDGIAGIVGMENKTLYVENRFGAFKIAKQMNVPILPIWIHNEYNTFDILSLPLNYTRKYISEMIGLPLIFPYIFGWYGLWMPKRVRLSLSKGEIIKPELAVEKMKSLHVQTIRSLSTVQPVAALPPEEESVTGDNHHE
jgi:1-acyl-sn-glycerol-3-phosphate acyltransferase